MNSTKIITFDYLKNNCLVHAKVSKIFKQRIKNKILEKYGSLNKYANKHLKICPNTIGLEFRHNKYFKFKRLLRVIKDVNVLEEELYNDISAFFARGSHSFRELILNKEILVDEFFVEGYALYLAEGDTGFSGKTKPRKFRFTNSEINVINHMIRWIKTYFPNNDFYVNVITPNGKHINFDGIRKSLEIDKVNLKEGYYNKVIKYIINLNQTILIDLILAIEPKIKELCRHDKKLAAAYIRGMMIGEGTAYFNRSRYVRIEMRNEKEIKYLHELFKLLGYDCKPSLRSERHNMWSIYIGAKQLAKFHREIGFGVHKKRQKTLEKGVNKRLRVNQYC
ncbi:hypothetical protein KY348_05765 [Candidatus Woesearchaeota archaeon]|nr:hypothetical protein [Candidatus Woesearchaeota archaeon]